MTTLDTASTSAAGSHASDSAAARTLADVATVRAAVSRLAAGAAAADRWTGPERHGVLTDVDQAIDALTAVRAALLVAERDAGTWRGKGDRSVDAWWARTSCAGQRAAAAQIRQADHLDVAPPATAAAVVEGRIRVEHAAAIGAVMTNGTPAQQQALQSPAGQHELLRLAESEDAGTFATTLTRWAATIDPAAFETDHQAQRRERFLQISHTPRGTVIKGRLDSMAGRRLTLALEAVSPRPGADDDRDPGQRCADALDAIATRTTAADPRPGAHVPVQVSLILTEQTWLAVQADRDRRRTVARAASRARDRAPNDTDAADNLRRSTTTDCARIDLGASGASGNWTTTTTTTSGAQRASYPPATLEDGTAVPASELAAAMCDCEITRIVIDADSVPLDVGRAQRLFTGAQRRAVIARDRECAWPTCHAHARWCEVHHVAWWERDAGPTSVDNGVLLCSFHHHEVHRRDLAITRVPRAPSSRTPGSPPPLPNARPRPPDGIAQVGYEFRDVSGRPVGEVAELRCPVRGGPVGDEAPLEWTTDPMTGARVPSILLTG